MYNETVLQHYRNPRNVGEIENADGVGIYMSDFCGDITKFGIMVKEGRITDVRYKTQGCPVSIACGSALRQLVKNMTVEEALKITKKRAASGQAGESSKYQRRQLRLRC
jgi:nitrogen fixation NifU-like protein